MNESSLVRLKILVERAVRPVRASSGCKKRMHVELLAHLVAAFNEEAEKTGDESSALQATAARFGDPVELTAELAASVPSTDSVRQFVDWLWSRPGEKWWVRAIRQALLIDILLPVIPLLAWLAAGAPMKSSPTPALPDLTTPFLAVLLSTFWFTFLSEWMRRAMYKPNGKSWPGILVIVGLCSVPFIAYTLYVDPGDMIDLLLAAAFGLLWVPISLASLAREAQSQTHNQLEWASLSI